MSENNSTKKLAIGVNPNAKGLGKPWAYVKLLKYERPGVPAPMFLPSFRDLWRMIQAIAHCEDKRYPPPASGRSKLAAFLSDAVHALTEDDFAQLQRKYQIPERDGAHVVKTNGADVPLEQRIDNEPFVPLMADDIPWGDR